MNPRNSLRKVFGIYEHELNPWLDSVLPLVNTALDVGANDGYFTFGCAAAFRRRKKAGTIIAFEPQSQHFQQLHSTMEVQTPNSVKIILHQCMVGKCSQSGFTCLDEMEPQGGSSLIKIDVEGAEIDVVDGASRWMKPSNYFLIEVHREEYLERLLKKFTSAGITLQQINQDPFPLLGKETRDAANWWLVSKLEGRKPTHPDPLGL